MFSYILLTLSNFYHSHFIFVERFISKVQFFVQIQYIKFQYIRLIDNIWTYEALWMASAWGKSLLFYVCPPPISLLGGSSNIIILCVQ